jgi:LysM repeat protein
MADRGGANSPMGGMGGGGPGGGMSGGSGSGGSVRSAPSSGAKPTGGGGGTGNQGKASPGAGTTASPKGPGASQAAAKASAAKSPAAPAAKPGGSGIIGSKGGGATTQKPGAGVGPAKAGPTNTLKSFTAGSNLAANRAQQMSKVGQGFISSKTQSLKDQYSQYRSPPGVKAPGVPTAGRGTTVPTAPPRSPGVPTAGRGITDPRKPTAPKKDGLYQADLSKTFSQNWADNTLTGRAVKGVLGPKAPDTRPGQASPPRNFASPAKTPAAGPTVRAGESWTNPNGVPENVRKALADKGFNPDGTRMQPQGIVNRGPLDPSMPGRLAEAMKNYKTPTGPFGTVGSPVYNRPDLGPQKPAAAPPKVAKVDNASYFGDIRQPIGTQLGYQIGSMADDYIGQPINRGVNNLINAITGTPAAPAMKYAAPIGPQKPAATPGQLRAINTPSYPADPSLAGQLQALNAPRPVNPGALSESYVRTPGTTPENPIQNPGMGVPVPDNYATPYDVGKWVVDQGAQVMRGWNNITGMALKPIGAGINALANIGVPPGAAISGPDGITYAPGGLPRTDGFLGRPGVNPMATQGASFASPADAARANRNVQAAAAEAAAQAAQPPQMPGPTGQEAVAPTVPVRAPGLPPRPQARPGDFKDAYNTGPLNYPGADGVTGDDIGGVFGDGEAIAPAGEQNSYKVQRGDTLSKIAAKNGTTVKAIAEANGIKNVNAIKPGQTLSIPTNASIQPMGMSVPDEALPGAHLDPAGAILGSPDMVTPLTGMVKFSSMADPAAPITTLGWNVGTPSLDRYGNVGGAILNSFGDTDVGQQAPAQSQDTGDDADGASVSVSPSQEYDGPPDENFTQDDGQADDVGELRNRYNYEKDKLVDAIRKAPQSFWNSIINGDFRAPELRGDQGNGGRNWERQQQGGGYYGGGGGGGRGGSRGENSNYDIGRIIDEILNDQARLVFNTFR